MIDRSLAQPDGDLFEEMEHAILDQAELQKKFILIAIDKAWPGRCVSAARVKMREVARKVGAKSHLGRAPGIFRRDAQRNGLNDPDAGVADPIRLAVEGHLNPQIDANLIIADDFATDEFRVACRHPEDVIAR
uniref:hypothetical protein n=1 Tax=Sphingomonas sp. Sph1(2015) TaxID=1628084 RepID=UPI001F5279FF|nr:hypothetical protein [Sphingomonas sp. Sph1(2015)]